MQLEVERRRLLQEIELYLTGATTGPLGALGRAGAQLLERMRGTAVSSGDALAHVVRVFGLRPFEIDALVLAALPELDWQFGRLLAYAQDNPSLTRPTAGFAMLLAGTDASVLDLCEGPLVRDGLVALDGDGPLASRTLRATSRVAARLAGRIDGATEPDPALLSALVLDAEARRAIDGWVRSPRTLVLAGAPGSGRRSLARAACGSAGLRLVTCDVREPELARREAIWHDAAVMFVVDDVAIDWTAMWTTLAGLARPVIVVSRDTDLANTATPPPVVVRLEVPPEVRRPLWSALAPSADEADLDSLAARFAFGPRRIVRAVEMARAGETPLLAAARELGRASMGTLAQRMPLPFQRADLVVTDRVHAELDLARSWIQQHRRVQHDWGLGARIARGRGLSVLFAGEPGTGKTMAAQVLAQELELDLYLIDLARVLNKYIGETEKNLARLFDEAHEAGVMLFFDEGDALFGKRTETRDAHDRYANVETAYLLQRMEQHDGVTVLATNRLRDIDEAFLRRFHVIADFTLPEPPDRLQIWQRLLAPPVETEGDLRLPIVAREVALSGGQIRNAVLAAAHFAAGESRPIAWPHLERALRRELKQQGRVFDERVARVVGLATR